MNYTIKKVNTKLDSFKKKSDDVGETSPKSENDGENGRNSSLSIRGIFNRKTLGAVNKTVKYKISCAAGGCQKTA
jgi:hypothetical protein